MTHKIPDSHPLRRLFRGLTEHTFQAELGVADPRLVEYLSNLLAQFIRTDGGCASPESLGARTTGLLELVAQAAESGSDEQRQARFRRAGDAALFWTGVFPESLGSNRHTAARAQTASIQEVQSQGKRSYYLASTFGETDDGSLLRKLSVEFELCAFGLSRVRREWERLDPVPPRDDRPFLIA